MTKKARKFLLLIAVAVLISTGVIFSWHKLTQYAYSELLISDIQPQDDSQDALLPVDRDTVSLFSSSLKNASYVDDSSVISGKDPDLYISAYKSGKESELYRLYLTSIFKRTAYIERASDSRVYRLIPSDFTEFFTNPDFSTVIDNVSPLPAVLFSTAAGSEVALAAHGYPISGTWNHAVPDGTQKTEIISEEKSANYYIFSDGEALFNLYMENMPTELMQLRILRNDGTELLSLLTDGKNIPNPGADGYYIYELTAVWPTVADVDYNGSVTYCFNIGIDVPGSFTLTSPSAPQGGVTELKCINASKDDVITASCEELGWNADFTENYGNYVALIGIPLSAQPGVYSINTTINGTSSVLSLTVTEGEFPSQELTISTSVKDSWTEEQETYLSPLREYVSAESYINGLFTPPVEGKVTTQFGTFRYTNGALEPTRHNGIDIADKTSPDILAPMDGVVVFTMEMKLTGNTVVIDHGMNVLSYYYHLDSINVTMGQKLHTGDKIGVMGSTGYSTGDHLHYTVMVSGTAVDPAVFYTTDFSGKYA